jgi:hypothetical protein
VTSESRALWKTVGFAYSGSSPGPAVPFRKSEPMTPARTRTLPVSRQADGLAVLGTDAGTALPAALRG